MFAVFKSGGKQHTVAKGDVVVLEKLIGDAGEAVTFAEVLAIGDETSQTVGAPLIAGASVAGTIVEQSRADKIIVFKKKRRNNYRRKNGHRQHITVVRIDDILTDGKTPTAKAKVAVKPAAKTETATPEAKTPAKTATPETKAPAKTAAPKTAGEAKPAAPRKTPATTKAGAAAKTSARKAPAKEAATEKTATTKPAAKAPKEKS